MITEAQAEELGYKVIAASSFEVGLVKGDVGIKTWFCGDFNCRLPSLGNPKILEAVESHERWGKRKRI